MKQRQGRYADLLTGDGYRFVGHSESLPQSAAPLVSIGHTAYRRKQALSDAP